MESCFIDPIENTTFSYVSRGYFSPIKVQGSQRRSLSLKISRQGFTTTDCNAKFVIIKALYYHCFVHLSTLLLKIGPTEFLVSRLSD
jgi:hypothetical protein